jgi:hypothetical protein
LFFDRLDRRQRGFQLLQLLMGVFDTAFLAIDSAP